MKKISLLVTMLFALTIISNAQNTSPYWSLAGNSNATTPSKLGTTNNISLRFYTNSMQRMIINSASGLVGIGTPSPTERLHINSAAGTSALRVQVNGFTKLLVHSGGGVAIGSNTTPPANGLYVSGSVGIGTNAPSQKLHVVGKGLFTTGLIVSNGGISGTNTGFGTTGVYGSGMDYGVRGDAGTNGTGVYGTSDYIGVTGSNNTYGTGVYGYSYNGTGVRAVGNSYGVDARGGSYGVYAYSESGFGVNGYSQNSYGGYFYSENYVGISASTNTGAYAGAFYGNVYTTGTYQTSDQNLKMNIQEFRDAMSIINKLKPQNYEFKNDAKYASLHLPKGRHYGIMAQDLEQVLPNFVSEAKHEMRTVRPVTSIKPIADGKPSPIAAQQQETKENITIKAVNYVELIPIIIKGMQEQQTQIEKLNATNTALQYEIDELKSLISKTINGISITSSTGYLKQNIPNPASNSTVINYYLPDNTGHAQIRVTDSKGSALKVYTASKGDGQVKIKSGELAAGTYTYTLYVNDKKIDSKQMVIIK